MARDTHFKTGETVLHRYAPDGERLTVVGCDGCIATVRNESGETSSVPVGYLVREVAA